MSNLAGRDLTARELEVVVLVEQGLTNKQIGEQLSKSHYTIKSYVKRVRCKLELRNRYEVGVWYRKLVSAPVSPERLEAAVNRRSLRSATVGANYHTLYDILCEAAEGPRVQGVPEALVRLVSPMPRWGAVGLMVEMLRQLRVIYPGPDGSEYLVRHQTFLEAAREACGSMKAREWLQLQDAMGRIERVMNSLQR